MPTLTIFLGTVDCVIAYPPYKINHQGSEALALPDCAGLKSHFLTLFYAHFLI